MAKVNVFQKRIPSQEWETFTFRDPDSHEDPEQQESYTFTLRALNELERFAMDEYVDKLTIRYVTGGYIDPAGDRRDRPEVWMLPDDKGQDRPIIVTEEALRVFAEIELMQGIKRDIFDDTPPAEGYGVQELAILALTAPRVLIDLRTAVRKVRMERGKKKAPSLELQENSPTPVSA